MYIYIDIYVYTVHTGTASVHGYSLYICIYFPTHVRDSLAFSRAVDALVAQLNQQTELSHNI